MGAVTAYQWVHGSLSQFATLYHALNANVPFVYLVYVLLFIVVTVPIVRLAARMLGGDA